MSEAVFWWSDWIASRYPYFYKAEALRLLGREPDASGKFKNHSDFRRWKEYRTTIEGGTSDENPRPRPRPDLAFAAGQAMARAGDIGNDGVAALHAAGYYKETLSLLIALSLCGDAAEAVVRYATLPAIHRWLREPYDGPPSVEPYEEDEEDGGDLSPSAEPPALSPRAFARTERLLADLEEEFIRDEMAEIDVDEVYAVATGATRPVLDDRLRALDAAWHGRARLLTLHLSPLSPDEAELARSFGENPVRVAADAWGRIRRADEPPPYDAAVVEAERAAWIVAEPWAYTAAPPAYAKLAPRVSWYFKR